MLSRGIAYLNVEIQVNDFLALVGTPVTVWNVTDPDRPGKSLVYCEQLGTFWVYDEYLSSEPPPEFTPVVP